MEELVFRQATIADVAGIMPIIIYARNKMLADGKKQWTHDYPAQGDIESDIGDGHGYVLCAEGTIVAYGAIFNGEPVYDHLLGKWLGNRPYVVLHRLAVAADARRHGVATLFMKHVEQLAQQRGITSFRIDTNHDNDAMLHILDKQGFAYCGNVSYPPDKVRMAFEKLL